MHTLCFKAFCNTVLTVYWGTLVTVLKVGHYGLTSWLPYSASPKALVSKLIAPFRILHSALPQLIALKRQKQDWSLRQDISCPPPTQSAGQQTSTPNPLNGCSHFSPPIPPRQAGPSHTGLSPALWARLPFLPRIHLLGARRSFL